MSTVCGWYVERRTVLNLDAIASPLLRAYPSVRRDSIGA